MVKILFVCLGNICRSPMAEFVMKKMVAEAGKSGEFLIDSAGTCEEEIGNPVYPPARRKLEAYGIDCTGKTARQMQKGDYERYDLLIGMDAGNLSAMRCICGGDPLGKMRLLMDYTGRPGNVADPWFTRDFDTAWKDIQEGCEGLFTALEKGAGRA